MVERCLRQGNYAGSGGRRVVADDGQDGDGGAGFDLWLLLLGEEGPYGGNLLRIR